VKSFFSGWGKVYAEKFQYKYRNSTDINIVQSPSPVWPKAIKNQCDSALPQNILLDHHRAGMDMARNVQRSPKHYSYLRSNQHPSTLFDQARPSRGFFALEEHPKDQSKHGCQKSNTCTR
jgi:hypothetical protein